MQFQDAAEQLWFEDGTVVIYAEHKEFCLHSGLLAARSDVFRRILFEKNSDAEFNIERTVETNGRMVVKIPDSASDAYNFFLAMYDIIPGFFEPPPKKVATEVVLAVLKMSHKYAVPGLRRRALSHLNTTYPTTLEEWDTRGKNGTVDLRSEVYKSFPYESTLSAEYHVLKVVKDVDALWLLPAIFYECCQYDIDVILTLFKRMRETGSPVLDEGLERSIIRGAYAHIECSIPIFKFLFAPAASTCKDPEACLEVRRVFLEQVDYMMPSKDPLGVWDDPDWDSHLHDMCAECHELCWRMHEGERKGFWEKMPRIYGQDEQSWGVLNDLRVNEINS